jgi:hypothetical protein
MRFGIYNSNFRAWLGTKHGVWMADCEEIASVSLQHFNALTGGVYIDLAVRPLPSSGVLWMMTENPTLALTPFESMEWYEERR